MTFHESDSEGSAQSHAMNMSCAFTTIIVAVTYALRKIYEHMNLSLVFSTVVG